MAEARQRYECSGCGATFGVRVTSLEEPGAFISERDRATLRAARGAHARAAEAAGQLGPTGDPVSEVEANLLESFASRELDYATCPDCGARNPKGLALVRRERARARSGTGAFFSAVAVSAYFWPPVALAVPIIWAAILGTAVLVRRRAGTPAPWWGALLSVGMIAAAAGVVVLAPAGAPVVPLALGVWMVLAPQRRGASEEPFERARARLVFERAPFREPGRLPDE